MQFHSFLELIPKIQELRLPGLSEQLKMAPKGRKELLDFTRDNPKRAAVICLFFSNTEGGTSFYLIRRSTYPGVHSNQVGFPGGRIDSTDLTAWHAAKRELNEELGIPTHNVQQIKVMTPLYIPPSNFLVDCFLGYADDPFDVVIDDKEVKEVIEVSLSSLVTGEIVYDDTMERHSDLTPTYVLSDNIVWGATAMILAEIKSIFLRIMS